MNERCIYCSQIGTDDQAQQWLACRADGHANKTAIEELQESNRAVTEKWRSDNELRTIAAFEIHELMATTQSGDITIICSTDLPLLWARQPADTKVRE